MTGAVLALIFIGVTVPAATAGAIWPSAVVFAYRARRHVPSAAGSAQELRVQCGAALLSPLVPLAVSMAGHEFPDRERGPVR